MPVEAAYRLLHTVTPIFGAFFDAVASIEFYTKFLESELSKEVRRRGLPPDTSPDALHAAVAYGVDRGGDKPEYVHSVTFSKFKERNAKNGPTTVSLANGIAIEICALWEHRFRQEIANEFGVAVDRLKVPLFGDLRLVRNAIIHASGRFDEPISRLQVMTWVTQDSKVEFDEGKIIWLSERIEQFAHEAEQYRPAV